MKLSLVSVRAYKKKAILLLKNARHIVFLLVFSFMIVQPGRFFVEPPARNNVSGVYASYDELIEQSKQQPDGTLRFDGFVVGEDGQTTITYKIVAGDTLSSIAQDFGTTVLALAEKNNISPTQTLRKGGELIIAFTENYVYVVEEQSTLQAFADENNINIDDLMSLNYLTPPSVLIEEGQEIILPLTKSEAKAKGLVGAEEFVPLALEEEIFEEELPEEEPTPAPKEWSLRIDDSNQEVITPEETEQYLALLSEEQLKRKAELDAQMEAKRNEEIRLQKSREEQAKKEQEVAKIKQQAPSTVPTKNNECNANQCLHDGACRSKPAHAVCAPTDKINAWVCEKGYIDTGKSCVKEGTIKASPTKTAKKKSGVVSQWYFNARKTNYDYNGRARGHCTEYVDAFWQKNFGVKTFRRGNANQWYKNAAAAGASVGQTPKYGAAAVFAAGTNSYRGYGHVAVVIDTDRDNNLVLVEEQNYIGTFIASQRWVSMDDPIGYIYP